MVGILGNRDAAGNIFNISDKNWKKHLKALKKQNNIIYSMVNSIGSCRELKNNNNIHSKVSN